MATTTFYALEAGRRLILKQPHTKVVPVKLGLVTAVACVAFAGCTSQPQPQPAPAPVSEGMLWQQSIPHPNGNTNMLWTVTLLWKEEPVR